MQGCPLSGTLYASAMDPCAKTLVKADARYEGVTMMCADDVGSALSLITDLLDYKRIFDSAAELAGQCLKPAEMFIVPLVVGCWEAKQARFSSWVA